MKVLLVFDKQMGSGKISNAVRCLSDDEFKCSQATSDDEFRFPMQHLTL